MISGVGHGVYRVQGLGFKALKLYSCRNTRVCVLTVDLLCGSSSLKTKLQHVEGSRQAVTQLRRLHGGPERDDLRQVLEDGVGVHACFLRQHAVHLVVARFRV